MRRALIATLMSLVALPALANDDIVLRGMGSFHVGGRIAEVSGKEVRQIQRQPRLCCPPLIVAGHAVRR